MWQLLAGAEFLHDEERDGAEHGESAEVPHKDAVGVDELLVGSIPHSGSDPNGDGIEDDYEHGAGNIYEIIELRSSATHG